jgi:hypothetical protein
VKLKIQAVTDDKPVKISLELPAAVHRDLVAYAEAVSGQSGHLISDPTKLIVPMLTRFMATDRAFARARKHIAQKEKSSARPKA